MDRQFSKEEVAEKVLEQSTRTGVFFTHHVMGGGGHIHRVYRDPTDGVKESANRTANWMMTQMDMAKITKDMHVLDVGSGHGQLRQTRRKSSGAK